MRGFLRRIWIIARHELADSVRNKRVLIFMVLYIAGTMLAYNQVITFLHNIEAQLLDILMLPASSSPGAVADALWKSNRFQGMIAGAVENSEIATQLISLPPMAVIYFLLIFMFTPPLIIMSASGRMAEEIGNGSARYSLIRCSRAEWCLGKFTGQALEIILPIMLSVIGSWSIVRFRLPGLDSIATLKIMIIFGWKVWLYSLPYAGMALGISQITRSQNKALALSCVVWISMVILYGFAHHFAGDGIRQLWLIPKLLMPLGHRLDLLRMDLPHTVEACAYLVTLAFTYLLTGYAILNRRDI